MTCRSCVARVLLCGYFGCASAAGDDGAAGEQALRRAASGYTATRYPIVLAHGLGGWTRLFGVYEYFYGIPEDLRAGGARVYTTSVSAFSSSEARGEELLGQVEYIAAASGAGKVNLIGHSQGGLDVRYVLAVRPDLLASVTTVGSPHQGADLADWLLDRFDGDEFSEEVTATLASSLGLLLDLLTGTDHPQDAIAGLEQLGSEGAAAFNARYPAGLPSSYCGSGPVSWDGVALYSWTGTSVVTNLLDVSDGPLALAALVATESSDGLVGRCSAHFGQVIRDSYRMNHGDEVNQVAGLVSLFETNPRSIFRAHANRLKNAGL
jgi:triacylglycerol lipase